VREKANNKNKLDIPPLISFFGNKKLELKNNHKLLYFERRVKIEMKLGKIVTIYIYMVRYGGVSLKRGFRYFFLKKKKVNFNYFYSTHRE
jgi:hypothetical protein